ncbi:hypothetical protein N324_02878 [Chlamydotis macqueenii]|nr:hypothetical protein N324_02878 [Chlamydotis macqueenii]
MRLICHQWPLRGYMRIILGECVHMRTKHDCQKYPASGSHPDSCGPGLTTVRTDPPSPSTEDCRPRCYESPKIEIGNNSADLPGGSRTETLAGKEALGCKGTAPPSVTRLYK